MWLPSLITTTVQGTKHPYRVISSLPFITGKEGYLNYQPDPNPSPNSDGQDDGLPPML